MKIFISHKQEDDAVARRLDQEFRYHNVDTYLDLINDTILKDGEALTKHIRESLNTCTDIIVVMSEKTRLSQWVPFEVGMSTQKDMPTVTFMVDDVKLPEFLDYWPRLTQFSDVEKYLIARERVFSINESRSIGNGIFNHMQPSTNDFYKALKKML